MIRAEFGKPSHRSTRRAMRIGALSLMIGLTACSGTEAPEPVAGLTGAVTKGPTANARIRIYAIGPGGQPDGEALATATTDANGRFSLGSPLQGGPFLVRSFGGSFIDESDQNRQRRIGLFDDQFLESILPAKASSVAINPYTDALVAKTRRELGSREFRLVLQSNRDIFSRAFGFDVLTTLPGDPLAPSGSAAARAYAMALGGAANAMNTIAISVGLPQMSYEVIRAFGRDLSDGTLDGSPDFGVTVLSVNQRALPKISLNAAINRFRNNNYSVYPQAATVVRQETLATPATPDNSAPRAVNDNASLAEDSGASFINLIANDSDPDGDSINIASLGTPSAGGRAVIDGQAAGIRYTPAANFNGIETITYTISDGRGGTASAQLRITVRPVNDPPTAAADSFFVAEDSSANPLDVLANDSDVDGDPLRIVALGSTSAGGQLEFTDSLVRYTPLPDFTGGETFNYTIEDPSGSRANATVTVTVGGSNDAPRALDDEITVLEDSGATLIDVLQNDSDADGDVLQIASVAASTAGSQIGIQDNRLRYVPAQDYNGQETFRYTITDGQGGNASAQLRITVTPVNDAPVADEQNLEVDEDTALDITLAARDVDGDELSYELRSTPAHGSLSGTPPELVYTPQANYNGNDEFSFRVSDEVSDSGVARIRITVRPVNDAPVASDDSFTVQENSNGNALDVLANDSDLENQGLSILSTGPSSAGASIRITGNGQQLDYTPPADFVGTDRFSYTIEDAQGGNDTALVRITVSGSVLSMAQLNGSNGLSLPGAEPGQQSGYTVRPAGDLNGDGFADVIIAGRPLAADLKHGGKATAIESGASIHVVYGRAAGWPAQLFLNALDGSNGFRISGLSAADGESIGASGAGDVDCDGFDDLLFGVPGLNDNTGAVYILSGAQIADADRASSESVDGEIRLADLNSPAQYFAVRLIDQQAGQRLGHAVSAAGDVNGDGCADVLIGAHLRDRQDEGIVSNAGAAMLVFGGEPLNAALKNNPQGNATEFDLQTLDGSNGYWLQGDVAALRLGHSIAGVGDLNGDGLDDIAIGAERSTIDDASQAGRVMVIFGSRAHYPARLSPADITGSLGFQIHGSDANSRTGHSISAAGDINGDGFGDLISNDNNGQFALLLYGKANFASVYKAASLHRDGDGLRIKGENGLGLGSRGGGGDFDADGIDDLLIANPDAMVPDRGAGTGRVYLLYGGSALSRLDAADGSSDGELQLSHLSSASGRRLDGAIAGGRFGGHVAAAAFGGDINGDGYVDLLLGAPAADNDSGSQAGVSYLVFGGSDRLTQVGSPGDDPDLRGSVADDRMDGLAGADTLLGLDGDDSLVGGLGSDYLDGGPGSDALFGAHGDDGLRFQVGQDLRRLDGGSGYDSLSLVAGDLDLPAINAGNARYQQLRHFEAIDLAEDTGTNRLHINRIDLLRMTGPANEILVFGAGEDSVLSDDPWIYIFHDAQANLDCYVNRPAQLCIQGALDFNHANGNRRDGDGDDDGLSDGDEVHTYGTHPENPDTDGDGILDGTEVAQQSDPLDPYSPNPVVTYFKASNSRRDAVFGNQIRLSADGQTMVVASVGEDSGADGSVNGANDSGAVYIFRRYGDDWTQETILKADLADANDRFGAALALSADGRTLAVGAPGEDGNGMGVNPGSGSESNNDRTDSGAVYVYRKEPSGWNRSAYIKSKIPGSAAGFGSSVALSATGQRLVIGAPQTGENESGGHLEVIEHDGSNWHHKLTLSALQTSTGDAFGHSVAISANGRSIAAGATGESTASGGINPPANAGAPGSGAVYLFELKLDQWRQTLFIKAPMPESGAQFGHALALSPDGAWLYVTEPERSGGLVYRYQRDADNEWFGNGVGTAENPDPTDRLGVDLQIGNEPQVLLAGAPGEAGNGRGVGSADGNDNSLPDAGAAYGFSLDPVAVSQASYIKSDDPDQGDLFGTAVAINGSGNYLAIGAPGEASNSRQINGNLLDNSAPAAGAVYFYQRGRDSDFDGISDSDEIALTLHPEDYDSDQDGLGDGEELFFGTDPWNPDSDGDGLSDGDEAHLYLSSPTHHDTDEDGLIDGQEVSLYGSSPILVDTDGDDLNDQLEVRFGTDPTTPDVGNKLYLSAQGNDGNAGDSWATALRSNQAVVQRLPGLAENAGNRPVFLLYEGDIGMMSYDALELPAGLDNLILLGSMRRDTAMPEENLSSILDGQGMSRVLGLNANAGIEVLRMLIRGGQSETDGGGIALANGSELLLEEVLLEQNVAPNGAGIAVCSTCSLTMQLTEIAGNHASGEAARGGGILNLGNLAMHSSAVVDNQASTTSPAPATGGGIYSGPGASSSLSLSQILRNEVQGNGGGLYVAANENGPMGQVQILESELFLNRAKTAPGVQEPHGNGGAIAARASFTLSDSRVSINSSEGGLSEVDDQGGGAIWADAPMQLEDCVIRGNLALAAGGGVLIANSGSGHNHVVRSCIIAGNQAQYGHGGGLHLQQIPADTSTLVEHSLFLSNRSGEDGGGLHARNDGELNLFNNLFVNNGSDGFQGGGLKLENNSGQLSVRGNTVAYNQLRNNEAGAVGGGLAISPLNAVTLEHNTIWFNDDDDQSTTAPGDNLALDTAQEGLTAHANNVDETGFQGNIQTPGDPLFLFGFYLDQISSPVINSGRTSAFFEGMDSRTTAPNGSPDRNLVDIAFHHDAPASGLASRLKGLSPDPDTEVLNGCGDTLRFIPEDDFNPIGPAHLVIGRLRNADPVNHVLHGPTRLDPLGGGSRIARDMGDGSYEIDYTGDISQAIAIDLFFDQDRTNPLTLSYQARGCEDG